MTYGADDLALIVLDSLQGLEYKHKIKLLSLVRSPRDLLARSEKVSDYLNESLKSSQANTILNALYDGDYRSFVTQGLERRGTRCITLVSPDYPRLLKETDIPPFVLYLNGNAELLKNDKPFAIVGSRKCLPNATALARKYSGSLAENGVVVVTGSAGGADAAAIEGAIATGNVISVLAGGIDHVYPEYNKAIIKKVAERGLVVSEQPPDYAPKPWMFPVRNRIIAGLSLGVLIVGGDGKSGARHTADYAVQYGRTVFAFPYSIGITSGELNNKLIKEGCSLCDDVSDITDYLHVDRDSVSDELPEDLERILRLIKSGCDDLDKLVIKTSRPVFEINSALSELEIEGLIVKLAGNKYKSVV